MMQDERAARGKKKGREKEAEEGLGEGRGEGGRGLVSMY
jgi:hypothetical protein